MLKKIIILSLFILIISSSVLLAAEPTLGEIQNLISQGKTEEALNILENSDLESDPDLKFYKALLLSWQEEYERSESILIELIKSNPQRLDFYNHLARIYGWQREFDRAEEIIEKAQKKTYSSERTAILSRHAEWQENYFEAKKLIKEAIAKADSSELVVEYEESLTRINNQLKTSLYLKGRAVYSEADKEDLELTFGLEKLLRDGINFDTAAGANYFKDKSNFVFKSKLEIDQPLIPKKTSLSSEFVLYNGGSREKYELNNSFDYLINDQNLFGVNYNLVEDDFNPDYQSLELEYEHRFKKTIMVLKNTSRRYDADWTADFSQHLDLYYPLDNYLLNFAISHYKGGDYVFKLGVQISDLFTGEKFNLSSLNLWFNDQKTTNLDFRMDLK